MGSKPSQLNGVELSTDTNTQQLSRDNNPGNESTTFKQENKSVSEMALEDRDTVGDLRGAAPKGKKTLGKRRPSELVKIVSMLEMEEEEELEKKAMQFNQSLKGIFKGFQDCTDFLKDNTKRSDPTDQHFAVLNRQLTDKVKNVFDRNSKDEERTVMGNKLAAIGFVEWVVDYYSFVLDETGLEGVTEGYVQEAHERGDSADNLVLTIREVLWNYSDCSSKFAEKISETPMFQFLVKDLDFIFEDGLELLEMDEERFAFMSAVGVLHNCARKPNIDKEKFRSVKCVETLTHFVGVSNVYVKTITLLALGNMIKEDEVDKMQAGTSVVDFLMQAVNKSLQNRDRKEYGFHLSELVDGLAALAQFESNKSTIMSENPLPTLKKILSSQDSHEVLAAIKLAWELAFSGENREKIVSDKEFMRLLKGKSNDRNKHVRDATTGALFVLEGMFARSQTAARAPAKPTDKHIMFSYSWKDKAMVYKIKDILEKDGHKIWIDVEQMNKYANLLEGMANAVEKAHTILVCYSESYKNSQNCRTEADYVFQLKKNFIPLKMQQGYTPDGWLGIFIGAKLYIEFTNKYPFDAKMAELKAQLNTPSSTPLEPGSTPTERTPGGQGDVTQPGPLPPVTGAGVKRLPEWQKHDVDHWVAEHGMSGGSFKTVKQLTGHQLNFLYKVYLKSPDTFFRWSETKLNLKNLGDLMLFHDAVEKLHIFS